MSSAPTDLPSALVCVEKVRQGHLPAQDLIPLLAEQSTFLHGVGAPEVERFRGYVLSSFRMVGLPVMARDIVLEELETGTEPYTIAAAAMALLGASGQIEVPIDVLEAARRRILARDVHVQYRHFQAIFDVSSTETAAGVIDDAIKQLSSHRQPFVVNAITTPVVESTGCCCCTSGRDVSPVEQLQPDALMLQDQAGLAISFTDFFHGRFGILTFFYTRCMNPKKCSLTISNLALIQRFIAAKNLDDRVRIGAISYDPAYDLPHRLAAYGRDRGLVFGGACRIFRSPDGFGDIQKRFELSVGFGPQTVNRHQIELFLLDQNAMPFKRFSRKKWDVTEVLRHLDAEMTRQGRAAGRHAGRPAGRARA